MTVLMKILQLVLVLSILIVFHELGHFLFARLFGIRVDKFYLFFDVGGRALFRFRRGDTEYGIGWLPLGGYCKISGMIDESMDTGYLKNEPQPWEFRSKPAWQRLLVMAGGVLFNFILAILVFSGIMAVNGETSLPNEGNCIFVNGLSYEMGFRNGDRILSYDGSPVENFYELQPELVRRRVRRVEVLRGGDTLNLYIDRSMIGRILDSPGMFELAMPFVIDSVPPSSVNSGADIRKGDRVLRIGDSGITFLQDASPLLEGLAGSDVNLSVLRGGDTLSVQASVDSSGKMGVYLAGPSFSRRTYSLAESFPAGWSYTWKTVRNYLSDLRLVATPGTGAYRSVGSFIAIGQAMPSSWNWMEFFYMLGLMSIMLGVMNLLPIPGLDGGHIVFTLYEMLTGRKPSDKFMMAAQAVGMVLLLLLMLLAFGNDIGRLVK